jgi:RNase P protein component
MRLLLPALRSDHDVILIARQPLLKATLQQVQAALKSLAQRANLLDPSDGH